MGRSKFPHAGRHHRQALHRGGGATADRISSLRAVLKLILMNVGCQCSILTKNAPTPIPNRTMMMPAASAKAIMRGGVHHNSLRRLSIFGLAQSEFAFRQSAAPSADVLIVIKLRHGYLAQCHRTKSAG